MVFKKLSIIFRGYGLVGRERIWKTKNVWYHNILKQVFKRGFLNFGKHLGKFGCVAGKHE